MRQRALLILATMLLGVMMLSGVALAKNITGTDKADRLIGTLKMDQIYGLGGPDYIAGKQRSDELYGGRGKDEVRAGNGRDRVYGGSGSDELYGGGGNDTISAADGYRDAVNCGLGTDTAYVDEHDRVNRDCEKVFGAGRPTPAVDRVSGTGELGQEFGSPRLHLNANSTGTSSDDALGRFSITYPDGTEVKGAILCLAVSGNEARLVGRINSASGPRAENGTFEKGEYVRIGVRDAGKDDQANFSRSEETFTSCDGENPNLEVVRGDFVVKDV